MADVPTVDIVLGVPTGGTGTVQTISTITDRLGEVQASPTSNTLLDRLKTIATALSGTLTVASHAVTNAGTFAVQAVCTNAGTFATQVSTLCGQTIAFGSGANGATVVRVALATDSPGVVAAGTSGSPASGVHSVQGTEVHDAVTTAAPVIVGGGASAAAPTSVSADGDVVRAWLLRNGATATVITAAGALIGGDATNGLDVDVTRVSTVAHDAADSENPLKIGAKAITSLSGATAVSSADRTNAVSGLDGAIVVRNEIAGAGDIVTGNASNTDGTTTSCIAASGDAAIRTYLQSIILTNMSATGIYVEIKDDTTVKLTLPLPANSGCVVNLPKAIPGTFNTAWFFDPSAAATTVYCSMVGFLSKV